MIQDGIKSDECCGLVRRSFYLALFLEVFPVEAGLLHGAFATRNLAMFLVVKILCLGVIFAPICVAAANCGIVTLKAFWRRVLAIILIVSLNIAMNSVVWSRIAAGE